MFEMQSVLQGPASAKKQLATMAALVHLSVATVIVVGLAWRIDTVEAPTFTTSYLPIALLPAEWSAAPVRAAKAPSPPATKAPAAVQPSAVPEEAPQASTTALAEASIEPLDGVAADGDPAASAAPFTDAGGVGPGNGLAEPAGTIVWKPGAGIVAPQVLFRVDPRYPEIARTARRQGAVVIEAAIATDGSLQSARVVSAPLGFGLEQSALEAIRAWRFAPARFGDRPVAVYYRWNILFSLR